MSNLFDPFMKEGKLVRPSYDYVKTLAFTDPELRFVELEWYAFQRGRAAAYIEYCRKLPNRKFIELEITQNYIADHTLDGDDLIIKALQNHFGEEWDIGPLPGTYAEWTYYADVAPWVRNWIVRRSYRKKVSPIKFKVYLYH